MQRQNEGTNLMVSSNLLFIAVDLRYGAEKDWATETFDDTVKCVPRKIILLIAYSLLWQLRFQYFFIYLHEKVETEDFGGREIFLCNPQLQLTCGSCEICMTLQCYFWKKNGVWIFLKCILKQTYITFNSYGYRVCSFLAFKEVRTRNMRWDQSAIYLNLEI